MVGIVDFEHEDGLTAWPERVAAGVDRLRVRIACYPDRWPGVRSSGRHSGDLLPGAGGLLRVGPLKIIFDGSLNTRTAFCKPPYA